MKAAALASILLLTACARRHRIEGLVIAVDPSRQTMTVSHKPVTGYMPAMVMPFHLAHRDDLDRVRPGARVRFEFSKSQARHIRVIDSREDFSPPAIAKKLAVGEVAPDFELTGQRRQPIKLSDFRGRVVAIDFIYTRCPLPDVCPRLSAAFAYASRRFRGRDLTLLSITVDPEYDTPEVLDGYARTWNADPAMWHFLTGSMQDVQSVAGRFGLRFWPEENMIAHSVITAVIDRQGRLAALIEGASYSPRQLCDLLLSTLMTTH